MSVISYATIAQQLERLSEGGEGIVFRVRNQPTVVYKEYKAAQVPYLNIGALEELMDAVRSWDSSRL